MFFFPSSFFLGGGGGGILIPCRIKRTDVGKLINKSSGDVEARWWIRRRQRCNTKATTPLNPSLLEGHMIPRTGKNRRERGRRGVEDGVGVGSFPVSC